MRHLLFLGTALAFWTTVPSLADNAAAQEPTVAAEDDNDDIVVTARRREERLQDVPIAITALNADAIASQNLINIEALGSVVPALNVGQSQLGAGGLLYLRGVGSGTGNALIDQSVSVNIDGVSMAQASLMHSGQYDMQQMEVLRGPQSLFFGKNSPGGVISLRSRDPGSEPEFEVSAGYEGEAQERYATAMLSAPITDTLGGRLFVRYGQMDGYYDYVGVDTTVAAGPLGTARPPSGGGFPNATDTFVRGTLLYRPNNQFTARFKSTYSLRDLDSYHIGWQRVYCPFGEPNFQGTPVSLVAPSLAGIDDCERDNRVVTGDLDAADITGLNHPDADADGMRWTEIVLGSAELSYDFQNRLSLTSVTGIYTVDDNAIQDQSALPTTNVASRTNVQVNQFTQELRLLSNWDGPFNFLVGALYEERDASQTNRIAAVNRDETAIQEQSAYQIFAQALLQPTENLELSLGARYAHEEKELQAARRLPAVIDPIPFASGLDETSANALTPEISVAYHLTEGLMLFASYREGFKSGGFDASGGFTTRALNGIPITYEPESAEGYEVGLKSTLLDGRLRFNVNAFWYDYTNLQVTAFDSVAVSVVTTNASGAQVEGAEFDINYETPIDGLTLRAAGAFLNNSYTDFISDCYTGQSVANGCNININLLTPANEGQDLSGRPLLQSPDFNGMVGFAYDTTAFGNYRLQLTGDVRYSDSYSTQQQQLPGTLQPDYTMYNASLRLTDPNDRWEVSLIGRNLGDEVIGYIGQSVPLSGSGTGTAGAQPSDALMIMAERGRQILLQVRMRPAALFGE